MLAPGHRLHCYPTGMDKVFDLLLRLQASDVSRWLPVLLPTVVSRIENANLSRQLQVGPGFTVPSV